LVLSKKTKENLVNNKVPKEIRTDVLKSLPNRCDSILFDEKTLIRYKKTDNFLVVEIVTHTGEYIETYPFCIDLITDTKTFSTPYNRFSQSMTEKEKNEFYENFKEKYFDLFMVIVTYLELTPITLNIIEPNRSFGTKKNDKIKNETRSNVILVTTSWNVQNINLSVSVRGHWRLQPCGVGRTSYKYVFTQPYEKGLVRRTSQKELVS